MRQSRDFERHCVFILVLSLASMCGFGFGLASALMTAPRLY